MRGTKPQIRRQMRRARRRLSVAEREVAERSFAQWLADFPPYTEATAILAYVATEHEFPTTALIERAWAEEKQVYLPRIVESRLEFAPYRPGTMLRLGRFGIPEPAPEGEPAQPFDRATVAFVPLVAWDDAGTRLGRGGGFYDQAFSITRPDCVIGLGYAFQRHAGLPCDPWDVKLDYVVTERGALYCGGGENLPPARKEDVTFNDICLDRVDRCRIGGGRRRGHRPAAAPAE
jgi:5-formyltetrahydrofolate cyclo-ligase